MEVFVFVLNPFEIFLLLKGGLVYLECSAIFKKMYVLMASITSKREMFLV